MGRIGILRQQEEEKYEILKENMIDAVLTASRKKKDEQTRGKNTGNTKKNKGKKNSVEWWDLECEKVIRDRKDALKKLKKMAIERIG